MASGKFHAKCTYWLTPVSGLAVGLATGDVALAVSASIGCLLGFFLTPDLDQPTTNYSEGVLFRHSRFLGMVWVTFWAPYARAVPHRSKLSHWPILGTVGRLLYLGIPLLLLCAIIGVSVSPVWPYLVAAAIGLAVSDSAHWAVDVCSSKLKRARTLIRRRLVRLWGVQNVTQSPPASH